MIYRRRPATAYVATFAPTAGGDPVRHRFTTEHRHGPVIRACAAMTAPEHVTPGTHRLVALSKAPTP